MWMVFVFNLHRLSQGGWGQRVLKTLHLFLFNYSSYLFDVFIVIFFNVILFGYQVHV